MPAKRSRRKLLEINMQMTAELVAATDAMATPFNVPNMLPRVIMSRIPLHSGKSCNIVATPADTTTGVRSPVLAQLLRNPSSERTVSVPVTFISASTATYVPPCHHEAPVSDRHAAINRPQT